VVTPALGFSELLSTMKRIHKHYHLSFPSQFHQASLKRPHSNHRATTDKCLWLPFVS